MKRFVSIALVMLGITLVSARAYAGGDYFRVYLNNKLILEQNVWDPFKLAALQLSNANANDKLTFHYSHCGKLGSDRKIAVKDASGKLIKEWQFADAPGSRQSGMVIPVKELLALQQPDLQFFYTAKELPKSQLVGHFVVNRKTAQLSAPARIPAALLPPKGYPAVL